MIWTPAGAEIAWRSSSVGISALDNAEMESIAVRGLTFDVAVGGPDDGVPVLLLHGFPQNHRQWDALSPALWDAGLRTIAVDQRGYSPGARPDGVAAYRTPEAAADAAAVLDRLGAASAHVIGHDWGALVAWQLALAEPARVRTLTAVSVPHPAALWRAMHDDPDQRQRTSYMDFFRDHPRAEELMLADGERRLRRMFGGSGLSEAAVERYVAPLRTPEALRAALNWYRAMDEADFAGAGPVAVPTTYVWSDADPAIGPIAASACAEHVTADYRFVSLPGISHWIPDQAPAALAAAALARIGPA